jgi:cytochrome c-type biogenesis protein CcmH/NrfG
LSKNQSIALIIAVIAIVVLYSVPTKSSGELATNISEEVSEAVVDHTGHDHSDEMSDLDKEVADGLKIINSGGSPMKGILKIRAVLDKDPNHLGALRQLGFMSMQTNQFEKAVERFSKIVEINPNESNAYFMLGKAYEGMGNTTEAVTSYQSFVETDDREDKVLEVKNRIKELSNNH